MHSNHSLSVLGRAHSETHRCSACLLWALPWNGRAHFGPHLTFRGKQWMISWERWKPWMRRQCEPSGPFLTREMAAYPTELNQVLAKELVKAAVLARVKRTQAHSIVRIGKWGNTLVAGHTLKCGHWSVCATLNHPPCPDSPRLNHQRVRSTNKQNIKINVS